jgi:hypothetical protein
MSTRWPEASLDPVRRALVLAAVLPGAGVVEATHEIPFEQYWSTIADLERSVPTFDDQVRRIRINERDGERLHLTAWTKINVPWSFDVTLADGWCVMMARPRVFMVVMAAVPDGDRTRAVHIEAVRAPVAGRVLRPMMQRNAAADVRGIRRLLGLA